MLCDRVVTILLATCLACLGLCIEAQGSPGAFPEVTSAVGGTYSRTDTPDRTYVKIVPVQAVLVADDDGGRQAHVIPADVAVWIAYANEVFSNSGIAFSFDPDTGDFSNLKNTLVNSVAGLDGANLRVARATANAVSAGFPGKMVVFFCWGPGASPTGVGFSWWDLNFIAMPGFPDTPVCNHQNIGLFAHEIGHFLGLPHTFRATFSTNAEAESFYLMHGANPFIFDGDGIVDTAPDPFISALGCDNPSYIVLAGDVFPLQTDNIMGYWDAPEKTLTPDQIDRVSWLLDLRLQFQMAMPTNFGKPNSLEFDSLSAVAFNIFYGFQGMAGFGFDQWAENDQLFCGSGSTGWISFEVNVPYSDTYDLDLYATRSSDFGIVGVWWDGIRKGGDIDLYAPIVVPTGELALGTVSAFAGIHHLTVQVVGKNPASSNYFFGLDALALEPVGCNCDSVPGGCQGRIGFLTTCLTGPYVTLSVGVPGCKNLCGNTFDRNGDQDVDLADLSFWMRQFSAQVSMSVATTTSGPVGGVARDMCNPGASQSAPVAH